MKKWSQFALERPWLIFLLFIILIYGQTLWFGYALSDLYVTDPVKKNFEEGFGIFHLLKLWYNINDYRPLVLLSFGLEYYFFNGFNPSILHFTNVFLFWMLTCLIYKVLNKIIVNNLQSTLIILLFIAHPIHVEVVASLKNRDVLLSSIFVFISLFCLLKYLADLKRWWLLILSLISFFLAIMSKLDAVGLILFVPFLIFYYNKRIEKNRILIPLITFLFALVFLNKENFSMAEKQSITLENKISTTGVHFTENPIVELDLSYFEKIPYGIQTFMLYIKKLLLPIDFCYYYGYPIIPFTSVNYIAIISFCIFSLGIFFIMYKSKEPLKLLLFFLAFIAFSAFALNIIAPLAGIIADRLIFIASFFFIAFIFFIANKYILKFKSQIFITLIIVLTTISIYRTSAWKDIFTLLERDFERAKGSYEAMRIAANNYKEFADTTSNLDLKKTYLEKAILMSELGHNTMPEENKLLQYKAVCEFAAGKNEAAKKSILSSFRNDSTDAIGYKFLGDIFYLENNSSEAIKNYYNALLYDNKNQSVINSISSIYLEKNSINEANHFNDSILKINPNNFAALENNGYTCLYLKDTINAEINFKKAFDNGLNNPEIAQLLYHFFSFQNKQEKMDFYFNLKNAK